jgi:hypothetical protein
MLSPEENQRQYRKWLYYRNVNDAFDEQGPSFRYRNMPDPPEDWDQNAPQNEDMRRAAKFLLHLAQEGFLPEDIDRSLEDIAWELEWKLKNIKDTLEEEIANFFEERPDYQSAVSFLAKVFTVERELILDLPDYGFWFSIGQEGGRPLSEAKTDIADVTGKYIEYLSSMANEQDPQKLKEAISVALVVLESAKDSVSFNLEKLNPNNTNYGMGDFDEDFGFGI